MLISHRHNDETKAKRQRISHKLEKHTPFPEVCSEHLGCVKCQRHQNRVNNNHVLLTYLEWVWTPHSENVARVYPFATSSPFRVSAPLPPQADLCSRASLGCLGTSSSSNLGRESSQFGYLALLGVSPVPLCAPWLD